jgi:hypothetical protein
MPKPNFDALKAELETYHITYEEYIEGGYSLIGQLNIPSAFYSYNQRYRNITLDNIEELRLEVFLLMAKAIFDACDERCYYWPSLLKQSNFPA